MARFGRRRLVKEAMRSIASVLVLAIVTGGSSAWAQDATPESDDPNSGGSASADAAEESKRERARTAYAAGKSAFTAGDYAAAAAHFELADSLIPTVQAQYWRAVSLAKAERVPEALQALDALLVHPERGRLKTQQLEEAQKLREELAKKPARLLFQTNPAGASLTVTGVRIPDPTPAELLLVPGTHEITVELEGYSPQRFRVEAQAGARLEHTVEMVPLPRPQLSSPPVAEPTSDRGVTSDGGNTVPGIVTLAIAGASGVVGTIFGIQALNDKEDFDDQPTTSRADDVERNALIADMAFGVTLTLGITGLVLLFTDESGPTSASHDADPMPKVGGWRVAPLVGSSGGGAVAGFEF